VTGGLSVGDVLDLLGAFLVLLGCFLCFAAALGLLRFPDVLARMHAATKPQTLGLILLAAGVELSLRSWAAFGTLVLIATLQLATAPVSAHLVVRTVYRTDQVRHDLLARDDLAADLEAAGFHLGSAPEDEAQGPNRPDEGIRSDEPRR
jgi:multicomponent Na+:H+ antiporter subunit G